MTKTIKELKEEVRIKLREKFCQKAFGASGGFVYVFDGNTQLWEIEELVLEAQQQAYNLAMERVKESLDIVWKEMTERTYKHTLEGKNSPFEVTQEDWDNSSFTIEEFKERLLSSLTTDKNIT